MILPLSSIKYVFPRYILTLSLYLSLSLSLSLSPSLLLTLAFLIRSLPGRISPSHMAILTTTSREFQRVLGSRWTRLIISILRLHRSFLLIGYDYTLLNSSISILQDQFIASSFFLSSKSYHHLIKLPVYVSIHVPPSMSTLYILISLRI